MLGEVVSLYLELWTAPLLFPEFICQRHRKIYILLCSQYFSFSGPGKISRHSDSLRLDGKGIESR